MRKFLLSLLFCAAGAACLAAAGPMVQGAASSTEAANPQQAAQAPATADTVQQAPQAAGTVTICGNVVRPPANLPPAGSGPYIYQIALCFPKQDNKSVIEGQTYLYYVQTRPSRPSANEWVAYDDKAEKVLLDDFKRLWSTNFLDDLSIDVLDYSFPNGVDGKIVVYNMEERQRVKIVDYDGNRHVETTKIDEKLKEENAQIRLDSFLDQAAVQKVRSIIKDMEAEKGYEFATVNPEVTPIQGSTKTVHLTYKIDEGPKVKIKEVAFVGNKAISSGALKKQMKNNKQQWFFSFITSRGTYQKAKYEEDAEKVVEYYRDQGYIAVRVGEPDLKYLEDSKDRQVRWVQLRIPVSEGERYRVGSFSFDGVKVVKEPALRALFKLKEGDWYSEKVIRKGLEKAREIYGSVGYFEFTGFPDLKVEGQDNAPTGPPGDGSEPKADGSAPGGGPQAAQDQQATQAAAAKPRTPAVRKGGAPRVDVVMRMQEGKQYFVNRITFQGNTTTRDNVVRREMRLVEGGVFNTEALKFSIKRINQLGYFKNLEGGKDLQVEKTPGADNKVDVTLKVEEQNRNQITFGAGVSQFEGFFGQLGFQTANFMGRGETFNISLQAGSRAQLYQVGFTEPFLFDRNITGGINLYKRRLEYLYQFTEASTGGDLTFGVPVKAFDRFFINYSYARTKVENVNPAYLDPTVLANNPYLAEQLLVYANGSRTVSKITPSYVYNTVDNPIFPSSGRRYTAAVDLAGIGGDTNFYKPTLEGVWYIPVGGTAGGAPPRTTIGLRAQGIYLAPFSGSSPGQIAQVPIFERLVLGGEYSVRGFDIRSIGPRATNPLNPAQTGYLVIGGNKSLLFNAEYQITVAGPVRLILFADAGQVRDFGERFAMDQFKTSTGAEIRFFMPVLNVPFRLIMAYNPNRSNVYDNSFQPQKAFSFRFAVGSTF